MTKLFRDEVTSIKGYHLDEQKGIKLNQNEAPWDIPVPLKAAVVEELLKTPWNRYPLGDVTRLKKKGAKYLKVWPDNLVFANGSNVLIQAIIIAAGIGKKILVFDPTFSVYELQAGILGARVVRVPLEEDFSIPLDKALKTIKSEHPAVIFIANPNAPTGNLFNPDAVKKIIEAAPGLVVIDEAYHPFSGSTVIEGIKQNEHLIVLRTFSKAFAGAGLRLGTLIADPEVAREVQKCLLPFCMNRFTFAAASVIFDHPEYVDDTCQKIVAERKRIYEEMKKITKITVHPSDSNYILFESAKPEELFRRLLDEGVVLRQIVDGRRFQCGLRVTIGAPLENNAFLIALKKWAR